MKLNQRFASLLFILTMLNILAAQEPNEIEEIISWDKKEIILRSEDGIMFAPGSMQLPEQTFTLKNISDTDITIQDVVGDCTCLDIIKEQKTVKPGDSWSFSLDIKIPKYGVERDITFVVITDKGNDKLKLLVKSKDFVKPSTKGLSWELNEGGSKRILFETQERLLSIADLRILGDGFKAEVLEGLNGIPIIEVSPVKEGFDKGMLKMNIKNDSHQEALSFKLEKQSE